MIDIAAVAALVERRMTPRQRQRLAQMAAGYVDPEPAPKPAPPPSPPPEPIAALPVDPMVAEISKKLAAGGYTVEGARLIGALMRDGRSFDEAAKEVDRHSQVEPVQPSGSSIRHLLATPVSNYDGARAMSALMAGDDDTFLRLSVPAALKEGRGG